MEYRIFPLISHSPASNAFYLQLEVQLTTDLTSVDLHFVQSGRGYDLNINRPKCFHKETNKASVFKSGLCKSYYKSKRKEIFLYYIKIV